MEIEAIGHKSLRHFFEAKGNWSMIAARNRRFTFKVDGESALIDMDREDYHGA